MLHWPYYHAPSAFIVNFEHGVIALTISCRYDVMPSCIIKLMVINYNLLEVYPSLLGSVDKLFFCFVPGLCFVLP